jgi:hypothetical protein
MLVQSECRLEFSLTGGPSVEFTPNKHQLAMDCAQEYVGTCFNRMFIHRVLKAEAVRRRVLNDTNMTTVLTANVVFEGEKVLNQTVLHGVEVVTIADMTITGKCGNHITVNADMLRSGFITVGMIVPVFIKEEPMYKQQKDSIIQCSAFLLSPVEFDPVVVRIAPAQGDDIAQATSALEEIAKIEADARRYKRCEFFKSWLYPHKDLPNKRGTTFKEMVKRNSKRNTYWTLTSQCDQSILELVPSGSAKIADRRTFAEFAQLMTDIGREFWTNVLELCRTYNDDDVYNKHSALWKYYESIKDSDDFEDSDDEKEESSATIKNESLL